MQLNRADVEWLLATLEHGRGPVDWNGEGQRNRKGLDLRGARLEGADLRQLPLAKLQGGLSVSEIPNVPGYKQKKASIYLMHANFSGAQLEGANLVGAQLEGAMFYSTQLEGANLVGAQLEGANFSAAQLAGANLFGVQLAGTTFYKAQLAGATLFRAQLAGVSLYEAQLAGASLCEAQLTGADLRGAQLTGADLRGAKLESVQLVATKLTSEQGVGPDIADASWAGTNLSVVTWSDMVMLGDEARARQWKDRNGNKKAQATRIKEYRDAMRATHQLAIVLQDQGLTTDASRFAYRAKMLERTVRRYELRSVTYYELERIIKEYPEYDLDVFKKKWTAKSIEKGLTRFFSALLSWLFSWFLFLIAGYGYRLRYCLMWYVFVVGGCTLAYLFMEPHYFTWWTALAESVNVFHGRGASPNLPQLAHPARFAALTIVEAWTGLVIEVVLVATLIQRFFGK